MRKYLTRIAQWMHALGTNFLGSISLKRFTDRHDEQRSNDKACSISEKRSITPKGNREQGTEPCADREHRSPGCTHHRSSGGEIFFFNNVRNTRLSCGTKERTQRRHTALCNKHNPWHSMSRQQEQKCSGGLC